MRVIALLDRGRGRAGFDDLALDRPVVLVEDRDPVALDHRPIAFVEVGDTLRPRRDRQRIRPEIILPVAIADGQRSPHPRADDQIGLIAEQKGDGERADQPRQHRRDRILRRRAALDLAGDEMADDFGIGLTFECAPFGDQFVAEQLEILDDAVVDQRDRADDVRVGVADGRGAVGRPARVGDTGRAVERMGRQLAREIVELALGPPPDQLAALDGADAGRVIAAIFEPLEPVE